MDSYLEEKRRTTQIYLVKIIKKKKKLDILDKLNKPSSYSWSKSTHLTGSISIHRKLNKQTNKQTKKEKKGSVRHVTV